MQNNYSLALSFIVSYSLFSEIEGVADGVNIAENGGVEDAGVTLSHLDTGVAEHLGYVLQTYAL